MAMSHYEGEDRSSGDSWDAEEALINATNSARVSSITSPPHRFSLSGPSRSWHPSTSSLTAPPPHNVIFLSQWRVSPMMRICHKSMLIIGHFGAQLALMNVAAKVVEDDVKHLDRLMTSIMRLEISRSRPTLMHIAAANGNIAVIVAQIAKGAQVDAVTSYLNTPLHNAAEGGYLDAVAFLIHNGANVNAANGHSFTPLHLASKGGHATVVRLLLDKGADVNAIGYWKMTALHNAAIHGDSSVVETLLDANANVNAISSSTRSTALHHAAVRGDLMIVKMLVDRGANVKAPDWKLRTALHRASERGHDELIKLLVSFGASVDARDDVGETALHHAARGAHIHAYNMLAKAGAVLSHLKWEDSLVHR